MCESIRVLSNHTIAIEQHTQSIASGIQLSPQDRDSISQIDARVEALASKTHDHLNILQESSNSVTSNAREGFDHITANFERVGRNFEGVGSSIEAVSDRLEGVSSKLEGVGGRLEGGFRGIQRALQERHDLSEGAVKRLVRFRAISLLHLITRAV